MATSAPISKEYPNFYENMKEASMRLLQTVVTYEGVPYYIICIADSKPDGIFRVYMEELGHKMGNVLQRIGGVPWDYPDSERGAAMEAWMKKYPSEGVIRKHINSPHFNKFRPFDLGMCNYDGRVYYLERQPQRHTHQGLTQNMLFSSPVGFETPTPPGSKSSSKPHLSSIPITSPQLGSCIRGDYPTFDDCVKNLLDPDIVNDSAAFHRHFALCRGPIDTLFLAYKGDVIGTLPANDKSGVRISKKYKHTKEVVEELKLFNSITFA